jgi:hypothetical protein
MSRCYGNRLFRACPRMSVITNKEMSVNVSQRELKVLKQCVEKETKDLALITEE